MTHLTERHSPILAQGKQTILAAPVPTPLRCSFLTPSHPMEDSMRTTRAIMTTVAVAGIALGALMPSVYAADSAGTPPHDV